MRAQRSPRALRSPAPMTHCHAFVSDGTPLQDGSVYAAYHSPRPTGSWPPVGAVNLTTALTCNWTAASVYCQPPFFCENVGNTVMTCALAGSVPTPPPSPPPAPLPPAPPGGWQQCGTAAAFSGVQRVTGIYCSNLGSRGGSDCGPKCRPQQGGVLPACRYGGLLCRDGSVFAFYYPYLVPSPPPVSNVSLMSCSWVVNDNYCRPADQFCEGASGNVTSCLVIGAAPPAAPPPPPPPSPAERRDLQNRGSRGRVAGGVAGALIGAAIVAAAFVYFRRRRAARWGGGGFDGGGGAGGGGGRAYSQMEFDRGSRAHAIPVVVGKGGGADAGGFALAEMAATRAPGRPATMQPAESGAAYVPPIIVL